MKTALQPEGYWSLVALQFRKNHVAVLGFIAVFFLLVIAALADFIANDKPLVMRYRHSLYFPVLKQYSVSLGVSRWQPEFQNISFKEFVAANFRADDWVQFPPIRHSPGEVYLSEVLQRPTAEHWFGTDDVGRDVASRIVHGSRISLYVGFIAVSIYVLIGVFVGALSGFYGGVVDIVLSRFIEIMLSIPTLFLIVTVVAFLPQSLFNIVLVIGITNWPRVARLTRGEFLKAKPLEYVTAARALGASDLRTILRHILPNTLAPVFVAATFGVASAILIESTLSFLGFGVPSTVASWGSILSAARELQPTGWWLAAFPGLAIFLTVTSYNLVGEGLRDASDPRLRG